MSHLAATNGAYNDLCEQLAHTLAYGSREARVAAVVGLICVSDGVMSSTSYIGLGKRERPKDDVSRLVEILEMSDGDVSDSDLEWLGNLGADVGVRLATGYSPRLMESLQRKLGRYNGRTPEDGTGRTIELSEYQAKRIGEAFIALISLSALAGESEEDGAVHSILDPIINKWDLAIHRLKPGAITAHDVHQLSLCVIDLVSLKEILWDGERFLNSHSVLVPIVAVLSQVADELEAAVREQKKEVS